MTLALDVLLRDSAYKLDQFKPARMNALQASVTMKDAVGLVLRDFGWAS